MTKALFIHHSTGGNLIKQGSLRRHIYMLSDQIEFWDHSYNLRKGIPLWVLENLPTHQRGLSGPDGKLTGIDYKINLNNNDPVDYETIFSKDQFSDETLSSVLNFDIVIFKKCYPTSQIKSNEQLDRYMGNYLSMKEIFKKYRQKKFVIVTQPPLRSETTTTENAYRARRLATFLSSYEFLKGIDNLKVFNLFDLLTDSTGENANMLKRKYCSWLSIDSHPNRRANLDIAPTFAKFIVNADKYVMSN